MRSIPRARTDAPPRRRRRRAVVVVTVGALLGAVMAPSAVAAVPATQDQDATFYAWGANYNGQSGNGTAPNSNSYAPQAISMPGGVAPVGVAVGYQFDLALGADGQVYSWGDDSLDELGDTTSVSRTKPQAISLPGGISAVSIAAGDDYALAVGADGQIYYWGTLRGIDQAPQQLPTPLALPGGDKARSVD